MLNPHRSSTIALKTPGDDGALYEAALLCLVSTAGLWRLSSSCKASLSSSKPYREPGHGRHRLGWIRLEKSPLLFSKCVSTPCSQLRFPPALGVGLLPWLRQISPPLVFTLSYACIKEKKVIFEF